MSLRIVWTILSKELLDTVRDKRTLVMMLGVPILLYPAIMLVALQVALLQESRLDETVSRVGIVSSHPEVVRGWLAEVEKVDLQASEDPQADLEARRLDAVIVTEDGPADTLAAGQSITVKVLFDSTEFQSTDAAIRLSDALEAVGLELQRERLRAAGLAEDYAAPMLVKRDDVAPPSRTTGNLLGLTLPAIMVVMLVLGAFYPAVDVTAGEKERGTFETLLAAPLSKIELVAGKYLAVCILSLVTGLLNLISMTATFAVVLAQLQPMLGDAAIFVLDLGPVELLVLLALMIPLAALISALTMCVAVFARSFREAQNYVTPLFIIVAFPALIASFPGLGDVKALRYVPIANAVGLFRQVMTGRWGLEDVVPVFLSTVVFACLGVLMAVWIFQREEIMLSEERGIPLTIRRSRFLLRALPTPGMAFGLFGLIMLLLFYVASPLQAWRLLPGLLITQWVLLLGTTLFILWFTRTELRSSLLWHWPGATGLAGAVLAGAGWVVLILQAGTWHQKVLPVPEDMQAVFADLFAMGETPGGLAVLLFCVALTPAICEEFLFRGFILSGIRDRLGGWPAILLTALFFGVFHLSIYRLFPTALTGLLLGYLAVRSRSIVPGMVVHGMVNGISILVAARWIPVPADIETAGLPWPVLLVSVALLASGIALIARGAASRLVYSH
jgi:sodium transport system permease protein